MTVAPTHPFTTNGKRLEHEPALDGLRAVAVIAVVLCHVSYPLAPGGWSGVEMFFVLSGFLITRILFNEIENSGTISFGRFYARRCLRLMPAFGLLLLIQLIPAFFAAHPDRVLQSVGISATYMMNWNRAFHWLPEGVLGHTWSLAIEEQFYLLWPAILLLIARRRPLLWIGGFIVAVMAWRISIALGGADYSRTYNGFDTHCDALLVGCAIALLSLSAEARATALRFAWIPVAFFVVAVHTLDIRALFAPVAGLSLVALATAWIIVAAREPGWLQRALSLRPLVFTGKISYGLYLWHYPIMLLRHEPRPISMTLLLLVASYVAAVLSYRYIETPFLRLKSRFEPATRPEPQRADWTLGLDDGLLPPLGGQAEARSA